MKSFKCILLIIACFISTSIYVQNAIDLGLSVNGLIEIWGFGWFHSLCADVALFI